MPPYARSLVLAVTLTAASSFAGQVNFILNTTDVYGKPLTQSRTYNVYRPPSLSMASPVPAVFVIGGGAAFNAKADQVGYVVVTTFISGNSNGANWLNDDPRIVGPEDYDYHDEVIRRVRLSDNVSDVFVIGLSKSGHMAYAYACERPGMIKAASSVDEFINRVQNVPSAQVPIITFHGTVDTNVPYAMGKDSVDLWRAKNGLMSAAPVTTYESSPRQLGKVTQATWRGAGGTPVAFVTVIGGSHAYPTPTIETGYDIASGAWAFFSQFLTSAQGAPKIVSPPVDNVQLSGHPASFWVSATGTAPLSYQWQRSSGTGFVNIAGATSNFYTLPAATAADNGVTFRAVVTNGSGTATSSAATMTVGSLPAGPTIVTQPASATVAAGQPVTFSVSATGTGTLSYQWQKNGMTIAGANAATYTIPAALGADSGATFNVVVTGVGSTVGVPATLTVNPAAGAPVITVHPDRARSVVGQPGTFSVAATSAGAVSYQWQKASNFTTNLVNIAGATGSTYTIPSTVITDDHSIYRCVVTNSAGSATSANEILQVYAAPKAPSDIMTLPTASAQVGAPFSFTIVQSGGSAPITYSASPLPSGLSVNPTSGVISGTPTNAGSTNVTLGASNGAGAVSKLLVLTVATGGTVAPSIVTHPSSQTVVAGQSATFSVVASGTGPLSYQWKKNGAPISGATGASHAIASAAVSDEGNYAVTVSNTAGTVNSNAATLTVTASAVAPTIASQPADQTVNAGETATFSVSATGSPTPSYQWQRNGVDLIGATGTSYTTPPATLADDASSFRVVVGNSAGSVTSAVATLTVRPPATNKPPVIASATATPGQALVGAELHFESAATDPDGDSLTWAWDFGDGVTASGSTATHAYSEAGSHTATVTVSDGIASVSSSVAVTITAKDDTTPPDKTPVGGCSAVGGSSVLLASLLGLLRRRRGARA